MTKHSLPIHLLDTSLRSSSGKLRAASCALAFAVGQMTCFAQAGSQAAAQPAPAPDSAKQPDAAKQLDAIQKHIEQLESELAASLAQLKAQLAASDKDKDKDKQAPAVAARSGDKTPDSSAASPGCHIATAQANAAPVAGRYECRRSIRHFSQLLETVGEG